MNFAAITLCVASQRVFVVVSVYFVKDSVRKLLDKSSYLKTICGNSAGESEKKHKSENPVIHPRLELATSQTQVHASITQSCLV
jgi:hypothetical protein